MGDTVASSDCALIIPHFCIARYLRQRCQLTAEPMKRFL
ncbi:hypothetical protein BIWAKO_00471 [Bosea sp. BIWAKO-01]|nr:hypothetical protein BIWAKO_00471 [Bosea sp. BIWAKO-01]